MEHSEALSMMAAERYLLDEMIPAEREAFEEHFFSCAECAADVRDGRILMDSGKAIARQDARPVRSASGVWWAVAASIAFAAVIGYQNLVTIPGLHAEHAAAVAPRVVPSVSLLVAGSRGEGATTVASGDRPFTLYFDVPPQRVFADYRLAVRDSSGTTRFTAPLSGSEAKATVQLLVPAGVLAAGKYDLVVEGVSGAQPTELARYPFSVVSR